MKKIDIMNNKDRVEPGQPCQWQLVGGKVTKVEEFIPKAIIIEKEKKEEIKEIIKEVKKVSKPKVSKWEKKKKKKKKKK